MKILVGLLSVLVCGTASAQSVVGGDQMRIGPVPGPTPGGYNPPQISALYSGAIGEFNTVSATHSLAIGIGNTVSATNAMAVGSGNTLTGSGSSMIAGGGNLSSGATAFILGGGNVSFASTSLIVGGMNTAGTSTTSAPSCSLILGLSNAGNAGLTNSFLGGTNNSATGQNNLTLGRGLINQWDNCSVIGKYNAYTGGTGLLFVVGNGADATHPNNAVEVYNDGTTVMNKVILSQRLGDIQMGEFGRGNGD
jgi:hypothetical protein